MQRRDILKRVVLVTVNATAPRGGAEVLTIALARALVEQGLDVGLLTTPPSDGSSLDGPDDILTAVVRPRLGMIAIKLFQVDPWVLIESWRFFRRFRPDLIHLHSFYSLSLAPILAARLCGIPVVATLHDYWPVCFRNRLCFDGTGMCAGFEVAGCTRCVVEALTPSRLLLRLGRVAGRPVLALMAMARRRLMNRVAHFMVFSNAARAYLETAHVPGDRISVIAQGIPALTAYQGEAPPSEPKILYVGRLDRFKGVATLLAAFAAVLPHCPTAHLICVGEGPLRHALETAAGEHGLGQAVEFRGWVSREDLAVLYARARVCVLPSLAEMAPLAPREALTRGTPAIVTDLKGMREQFDNQAIWIVPPGDVGALAVALREAVTEDAAAHSARRAVAKHVSTQWPLEAYVADTVKVYVRLLGCAPPVPMTPGVQTRESARG